MDENEEPVPRDELEARWFDYQKLLKVNLEKTITNMVNVWGHMEIAAMLKGIAANLEVMLDMSIEEELMA